MSTTMLKSGEVARKWYVLDAAGKPMGKTAAIAADLLRGKLDPTYTPHVDCGHFVVIINAEQAVLTGKKLEQKYYRTHSGYPGGLHETQQAGTQTDTQTLARTHAKGDSWPAQAPRPEPERLGEAGVYGLPHSNCQLRLCCKEPNMCKTT